MLVFAGTAPRGMANRCPHGKPPPFLHDAGKKQRRTGVFPSAAGDIFYKGAQYFTWTALPLWKESVMA